MSRRAALSSLPFEGSPSRSLSASASGTPGSAPTTTKAGSWAREPRRRRLQVAVVDDVLDEVAAPEGAQRRSRGRRGLLCTWTTGSPAAAKRGASRAPVE